VEADSCFRGNGGVSIRDIPLGRNLAADFASSSTSCTGGMEPRRGAGEVSSPDRRRRDQNADQLRDSDQRGAGSRTNRGGTFVWRPRQTRDQVHENVQVPLGTKNKKRTTKQVWLPVRVQVVEEGSSESAGKRQRTASIFDRLEDPLADPARQGHRDQ
jgi:hypothetical protein